MRYANRFVRPAVPVGGHDEPEADSMPGRCSAAGTEHDVDGLKVSAPPAAEQPWPDGELEPDDAVASSVGEGLVDDPLDDGRIFKDASSSDDRLAKGIERAEARGQWRIQAALRRQFGIGRASYGAVEMQVEVGLRQVGQVAHAAKVSPSRPSLRPPARPPARRTP